MGKRKASANAAAPPAGGALKRQHTGASGSRPSQPQPPQTLYLLRGTPGSGKSSLARGLLAGLGQGTAVLAEADAFMVDPASGEYCFAPSRLPEVHSKCQEAAGAAMAQGVAHVFVANTFTQEWEMQWYVDAAAQHGYRVQSIVVENRHGGRSVHGVPQHKVEEMAQRFEVELM